MWARVALGLGAVTAMCGCGATANAGVLPPSRVVQAAESPAPATAAPSGIVAPEHSIPFRPLPPTNLVPSPPPPAPAAGVPAGTPRCVDGQIESAYFGGSGATQHLYQQVRFRNRSTTACFLDGYPDVLILDAGGRVLAQATGTANRATFGGGSPEQVLMAVGTPVLESSVEWTAPVPGQASLVFEWYDCAHPKASQLQLSFPGAGGRLIIAFPVDGPRGDVCDINATFAALTRGPLTATAVPPPPHYRSVMIGITAPASVARGSVLVYYVTLTNTDLSAYSLDPCADYVEILGPKTAVASYQLDCANTGEIAPAANVSFQMELPIPPTVPVGSAPLVWALSDERFSFPTSATTINVTP